MVAFENGGGTYWIFLCNCAFADLKYPCYPFELQFAYLENILYSHLATYKILNIKYTDL